jgi:pyruvate carboxylase subunit B
MAGKVILVRVAPGDEVKEAQTLVIIEAMKMENEIRATGNAKVARVAVAAGDLVKPGDKLVEFEVGADD